MVNINVPYNPLPGAGPSNIPTPFRTAAGAGPEAFGAGIGQSMEQFGVKVGQAGDTMADQILHYQNMINESNARDAVIKYAGVEGDAITQQYLREGPDAAKGLPDFQQRIQQARQDALSTLNPAARRIADQEITRRASFATIDASRHAAQQGVVYSQKTADAQVGLSQKDLGNRDPFNDKLWNAGTERMRSQTVEAEALRIFGPGGGPRRPDGTLDTAAAAKDPQIALKLTQEMDKAYLNRVQTMAIDQRNPFAAQKFFDRVKGDIADDATRNRAQEMIERQRNNLGTDQLSDYVVHGADYQRKLIERESGGRNIQAPTTTAGGLAQFTVGTWNDLASAHPELKLTRGTGMFNEQEVMRALPVFTMDNQQKLRAANIEPTQQNTYMAHFLGADGAVRFIQGMQTNPGQPAVGLVSPEAAAANRSVFYDKSGKPRTAEQVFERQTSAFGEPLTDKTGPAWLEGAIRRTEFLADQFAPGDATFKQNAVNKVTQKYNQIQQRQNRQDSQQKQDLLDFVSGRFGNAPVLDEKAITDNPQLAEKAAGLSHEAWKEVQNEIAHNNEAPKSMTPARRLQFDAIMSMDKDPDGERRFLDIKPSSLDLPSAQRAEIARHQNDIKQGKTDATRHEDLNAYLNDGGIASMLHGMKWDKRDLSDGDQAAYDQWTGAFERYLKDYKRDNNGKEAPFDEARIKAGQLLHSTTTRGMFGIGSVRSDWIPSPFTTETPAFAVPEGFMDEPSGMMRGGKPMSRSEAFEYKYGYKPGPREAGMIHYQMEEERKKQEATSAR